MTSDSESDRRFAPPRREAGGASPAILEKGERLTDQGAGSESRGRGGPPLLLLLTGYPRLHTPQRLVAAAYALGIPVSTEAPAAWWRRGRVPAAAPARGAECADFDVAPLLLTRAGTFNLVSVLRRHRELSQRGARPVQSRRALLDACDQWRTLRRLHAQSIAIPHSELVRRPAELPAALAAVAGPPWFVKGRRGSQGTQVELALDREQALRIGHRFWGTGTSFLVQEDLRPRGRVERHLVVAGRTLVAAIARPAAHEFRSNAHRGGRFTPIDPASTPAAGLAARAATAIGLPFAAVDTIGANEPCVLDVNASPGLEALAAITGLPLAEWVLRSLVAELGDSSES